MTILRAYLLCLLCLLLLLGVRAGLAAGEAAGIATIGADGGIELAYGGHGFASVGCSLFDRQWASAGAQPGTPAAGDDEHQRRFALPVPGQAGRSAFAGVASFTATSATAVAVTYELTAAGAGSWNSVNVSFHVGADELAGGTWSAGSAGGAFPATLGDLALFNAKTTDVRLAAADGREIDLAFPTPTQVLIQDDRRWGPSFTVRIGPQGSDVTAGDRIAIAFTLSSPGGLSAVFDHPVVIAAGPEWIPLHDRIDIVAGSALDFSSQGFTDAPCGRHGRVVAAGGHFAFADAPATARRFYGVNLCFTAQYLAHDEADRLADRLLRLGYNAVRIHHYDGFLVTGDPAHATWDDKNRDQLDYLLAAFAMRGIYVTTDLYVSRPVSAAELGLTGADAPKEVDFKVAVPVLPAAWDDWCAFARGLLDHVNPYNHVRLGDDPALAWLAMINEDNLENDYGGIKSMPEWKSAWNAWLKRTYADRGGLASAWGAELKGGEDPGAGSVALPGDLGGASPRVRDTERFLADSETAMFTRMAAFIHGDLKCAALLSDNSSWWNRPVNQAARTHFDYVDDHFYVDHPQFIAQPWSLPSRNGNADPLGDGARGGLSCLFTRLLGKPATITEFNYAAPGQYRAMGGLLTGALAAFQDLGGVWRFAYSHSREGVLESGPVDYFNLAEDPLAQAGDRAALCLFLRGDLAPAAHRVALTMSPADLARPPAAIPTLAPRWTWMGWLAGVGTQVVDDRHPLVRGAAALPLAWAAPAVGSATTPAPYGASDAEILAWAKMTGALATGNPSRPGHLLASDGGAIAIDSDHQTLRIDTARTGGGFATAGSAFAAPTAGLSVQVAGADATVFASALDGQPLRTSRHILVTHLTDLQNTGAHFAETVRRTLLEWGALPHLVRAGQATVTLTLRDPAALAVYRLGVDGARLGTVKATTTATTLAFTAQVATPDGACLLYEITPHE
jgi:hypothetical protein